jgi:DNA repair protein RadC
MTTQQKTKILKTTCLSAIDDSTLQQIIGIDKPMMRGAFNEWVRREGQRSKEKVIVKKSQDAYRAISPVYFGLEVEHFYAIYLTRSNTIIAIRQISKGGINGTLADAIILSHNHPSGTLKPSETDLDLTRKISSGALLLDIKVLDHIIVADNSYYSFADEGNIL